jgi:hypothetical protein
VKFEYLPEGTSHTETFDDLAEEYRSTGTRTPDWLQVPYIYSATHGCYIVKGSNCPYPQQAFLDERMHHTKLAAILDPDEAFDALRHAFFAPATRVCGQNASRLYELVNDTRGACDAVDGGIIDIADQLFLLDDFYRHNADLGSMPADFLEYG